MRAPTLPILSTLVVAIAATTVVALPTLLVGGLAVLLERDLDFGPSQLGVAVAASFGTGALAAAPIGRLVEHVGPRATMRLGLAFAATSLLGIGLVARSWILLVPFVAIAGLGVTTTQLGTNVLLARRIPPVRQGLAFGAKQAAVPLASLLAGLAVPVVGLTLGWQAAFLLAAAAVPLVALALPDADRPAPRSQDAPADAPFRGLLVLAVGVAFASAAGNSTPAFIVASAVDRGLAEGQAGLVLAAGSIVGIAIRVLAGWGGDRLGRGSLRLVAGLLVTGAAGFAGLAVAEQPSLIVASTMLAFGGGWGWAGLVILAVSRTNPGATGRAMGIVQVGPMSGAVFGPLTFGFAAEHVGYGAAWALMATFALIGAATILASRRRLRPIPSVA